MGVCESFSKVLLIIFNILFFIVGGVILGLGIWLKVDKSNLFELMRNIKLSDTAASFNNSSTSFLDVIAIILIIVGTFTFITGFCGCCGAMKESRCLLYTYSFLVGAVILIELGIGIYAGVEQNKFKNELSDTMLTVMQKNFDGVLNKSSNVFTKVFTGVMFELKCCGVRNQSDFDPIAANWKQKINGVEQVNPVGCCKLKKPYHYDANKQLTFDVIKPELVNPNCPIEKTVEVNTQGCVQTVIDIIHQNLGIVIGICVGLGLFEILCIVFACCVARQDD